MVNQDRLVRTFIEIAKIDSPTGFEKDISIHIVNLLKKMKVSYTTDKFNNVVGYLPGSGEPLLISAHMDTVEPGRSIKPIIKNGKIRSDGTTIIAGDNKMALAAILEAVECIIESGQKSRPLEIVFTSYEESGSYGVEGLDYKKLKSKNGYLFDVSLPIGTIITASPFYDRFDLEILGKASHASIPEDGINVVSVFYEALKHIKLGKVDSESYVNIGLVKAGDAINTVPEKMIISGEVRSFSGEKQRKHVDKIEKTFRDAAVKYGAKINWKNLRENEGYLYSKSYPFIKDTELKMEKIKIKPVLRWSGGCSDANVFIKKGIKVLNLGNGVKNPHTTREEFSISDMVKISNLILSLSTV
ncbi:MAG TPA: M20/M25/M40 family metallo-hydrolase [Patescibacteria group bacterium]|nr:M20/M25/M40 family metallo-hydrolase [Patescibacteria group bacterium]